MDMPQRYGDRMRRRCVGVKSGSSNYIPYYTAFQFWLYHTSYSAPAVYDIGDTIVFDGSVDGAGEFYQGTYTFTGQYDMSDASNTTIANAMATQFAADINASITNTATVSAVYSSGGWSFTISITDNDGLSDAYVVNS